MSRLDELADKDAGDTLKSVMEAIAGPWLDDNARLRLACAGVAHCDPEVREIALRRTTALLTSTTSTWFRLAAPELRDMVETMAAEPRTALAIQRDDFLWQLKHSMALQAPAPVATTP